MNPAHVPTPADHAIRSKFQSDLRLNLLKVHAVLEKVAHVLWTPVRLVQESLNPTHIFQAELDRKDTK